MTKKTAIPDILLIIAVALAYFISARLGLLLALEHTNATPVWPPSGIAFAAALLYGRKILPGVTIGAFAVNATVFLSNQAADLPTSLWVSLIISIGNTSEVFIGHYLINKISSEEIDLKKTKQVFQFALVALLMCLSSCSIGPAIVCIAGIASWADYPTLWFTWWMGDVTGVLVVTPLILAWMNTNGKTEIMVNKKPHWSRNKTIELFCLYLMVIYISKIIFASSFPLSLTFVKPYLLILVLLWAVFRFELREVITVLTLSLATAIYGIINGYRPFASSSLNEELISLQIYTFIINISVLSLKAALSERNQSEIALQEAHAELAEVLKQRTSALGLSQKELSDYQKRVNNILDALIEFTKFNFHKPIPISEHGDELDAIAVGINTMGEELDAHAKALKISEERFRLLVENIKDYAIFRISPAGIIETWNKGAERLKGYSAEEAIGKHFSIFYAPQEIQRKEPEENLKTAKEKGSYEVESWRVRKNGTKFWANITITSLYDTDGQLTGFSKITRDLTERQKIQEELRAQKDLYETLLNAQSEMGEGVAITEGQKMIYVNEALCKIYGYSKEELLGLHSFIDIVIPEDKNRLTARSLEVKKSASSLVKKS